MRSFIPIPSATSEHLSINSAVREKRNGNEERYVSDTSVLENSENSEWQLVNGRRKKKDTIRGVKISGAVKGVRKTMDVYVGRLDSSVTCDDLKSYINDEISVNMISCICLSSADAQVKSFKVTVYAEDRDMLLDENLWPEMFLYVSIFRVKTMAESIINNVRIVSYNCNSIRSEIDVIREILTRCDILLCQEIILPEEEIYDLFME